MRVSSVLRQTLRDSPTHWTARLLNSCVLFRGQSQLLGVSVKNILVLAAFFIGQMAMQDTPVVRLTSNRAAIQAQWGGMRVELVNAPSSVFLPLPPPTTDSLGRAWQIQIKNLGPAEVTVSAKSGFSTKVGVGRTVEIASDARSYTLK